jgi:hypothetical protein
MLDYQRCFIPSNFRGVGAGWADLTLLPLSPLSNACFSKMTFSEIFKNSLLLGVLTSIQGIQKLYRLVKCMFSKVLSGRSGPNKWQSETSKILIT